MTSPLGKSKNGCTIVVLGPTQVRYGMGERLERYEARGMQNLLTASFLFILSMQ